MRSAAAFPYSFDEAPWRKSVRLFAVLSLSTLVISVVLSMLVSVWFPVSLV